MNNLGIYIHVPFCNGKCYYCDFTSGLYSDDVKREYFIALSKEISAFDFNGYIVDSIYFGGGTPTSVNETYVSEIISLIKSLSNLSKCCEISIECNPESFTRAKAIVYKNSGINRLSFGVQSANDEILKKIGRLHRANDFVNSVKIANDYFDNISADIMLGLPAQTKKDVLDTITLLNDTEVKHISAYGLKIEKGTPLEKSGFVVDEDYTADLYDCAVKLLSQYGYKRYEVSNFAKPDFECKHNIKYWSREEYVGFGVSAHSFYNEKRKANTPNIFEYINGQTTISEEIIKNNSMESLEEYLFLGLRTSKGINLKTLKEVYGYDLLKEKNNEILNLRDFIEIEDNRIFLKDRGFYVMNELIVRLMP